MKLLSMHRSSGFCYFLRLGSKYFSQHPVLKHRESYVLKNNTRLTSECVTRNDSYVMVHGIVTTPEPSHGSGAKY
jgi:hypothetical protein